MLFNSIDFLLFFPIVTVIYFVIPRKVRTIWLLIASYYFYMSWNIKYSLLILTSTIITYFSGLAIGYIRKSTSKSKHGLCKLIVALSIISNLGILCFFKYSAFLLSGISTLLGFINISVRMPVVDIMLPVGISFYTFQALSYSIDVYRGETEPERNFIRYALFVSFFPQLVAGPIERSKNLLKQLTGEPNFDYNRVRDGLLKMLWGFFLKLVIADRIAIFVDTVYGSYPTFSGWFIVFATILFGIQIYCDFAGYSSIAIGAAKVLGIELMENFDAPYLSLSVAEFWRRWHISLTSWFKDYLYIPLGGSRKGKARKYINTLIVYLASGLWHGASLSFVIWGGLNGFYQIIGDILKPLRARISERLKINASLLSVRIVKTLTTFVLVDFAWLFFRANTIGNAARLLKAMFTVRNPWILVDGSLYTCGLSLKNYWIMIFSIIILLIADICKVKKISIKDCFIKQPFIVRLIIWDLFILVILVFGIWGAGYNTNSFIYFQF